MTTENNQEEIKEALKKLNEKLDEARSALREAEKIADKYKLGFHWDEGGYGMGGYYDGENSDSEDGGWHASSQSC